MLPKAISPVSPDLSFFVCPLSSACGRKKLSGDSRTTREPRLQRERRRGHGRERERKGGGEEKPPAFLSCTRTALRLPPFLSPFLCLYESLIHGTLNLANRNGPRHLRRVTCTMPRSENICNRPRGRYGALTLSRTCELGCRKKGADVGVWDRYNAYKWWKRL